ncbi:MAG: DUF2933 domain-containing protein [Clostridia bacterium]|nr:DUF2933 domain-containing protein [Clostridia bacterium]
MNKHFGKNKLHRLIMLLCCVIPMIMLGVLYLTKTQGGQLGSILSFALVLLCPLSHLLLMPLIMGKRHENTEKNKPSCH